MIPHSLRVAVVLVAGAAQYAAAQGRYTITDEASSGPGTPQVVVLHDNVAGVEAAVTPSEGGELSSYRVKLKGDWTEFLYHARDYSAGPGFKGKGPLLWPAVGAQYPVGTVPETSCGPGPYQVAGKTYTMPCHGFARTLPWKEIKRSADATGARVTVELRESKSTLAAYPFAFQLTATYELAGWTPHDRLPRQLRGIQHFGDDFFHREPHRLQASLRERQRSREDDARNPQHRAAAAQCQRGA